MRESRVLIVPKRKPRRRPGAVAGGAITIMKVAGHSSVTVSQRYVHPTPEGLERAFERLEILNLAKFEEAENEAEAEGTSGNTPTISPTVKNKRRLKSSQVVDIKRKGP